jgi:hypothetical protein
MKTRLALLFLTVLLLIPVTNFAAAQIPVFGPEKYLRETENPVRISKTFSTQNPNAEFTLVVQNGEGKRGRVSSSVVELNGTLVVGPNAFNKQVDVITKTVSLQQENQLVVEVISQPGSSIIITVMGEAGPPPSPVTGVTAAPDGFPVNTSTQVNFTAAVPYPVGGPVPLVELIQVSQAGDAIGIEGAMVDDGNLTLGDEIQGDGVFSFRKSYTITQPSDVLLRVKANLNGQVFYSDIFTLTAFNPITDSEATTINNIQVHAEQLYYQLLSSKGKDQALADVVTYLKAQSFVQDAGISEGANSVWIKYTNGMGGGISFHPPGTRGGSLPAPFGVTNNQESTIGLATEVSAHRQKDRLDLPRHGRCHHHRRQQRAVPGVC